MAGNFTDHVRWRMAGYAERPSAGPRRLSITARDETKFAEYFTANPRARPAGPPTMPVVVEPLRYTGQSEIAADIANFKAALGGVKVAEAFLPANSPGTIEHWLLNEYYKTDEEFLFAIADVMREEYRAIVDAGLLLQIDDPDLPDGWNCLPAIILPEYRNYAALRVEALNHALAGIPKGQVRLHVCWGSHHGPDHDDVPLKDIIDLIFRVQAGSFSIEASNPCHEHEWHVFEEVKMPEGASLVPVWSGIAPILSSTPTSWPSGSCAMPGWSAVRMSSPAPIAGSAPGSATRRSDGPNSWPWPKARGAQPASSGAAGKLRSHTPRTPAVLARTIRRCSAPLRLKRCMARIGLPITAVFRSTSEPISASRVASVRTRTDAVWPRPSAPYCEFGEAREGDGAGADQVRRAAARGLSLRIVRRAAPARDDRDGLVVQPAPSARRRADHRTRRYRCWCSCAGCNASSAWA
jgi:hypothetical protein